MIVPPEAQRAVATDSCLTLFSAAVAEIEAIASQTFDWVVPRWRLDVASRADDSQRVARHIHQMCATHVATFRRVNYIKIAYLGTFYLTEAQARNPLGLASAARALLEVHVFLRHVQSRLAGLRDQRGLAWQPRGERFFDQVLQARLATSDSRAKELAVSLGVPAGMLRPPRVSDCIKALVSKDENRFGWMPDHYSYLCDLVHANQLSQMVGNAGHRKGVSLSDESGGAIFFGGERSIAQYRYGSAEAFEAVRRQTCNRALEALQDAVAAINETPETAYSAEELITLTGDPLGVKALDADGQCPCGGGKTYKECHGKV